MGTPVTPLKTRIYFYYIELYQFVHLANAAKKDRYNLFEGSSKIHELIFRNRLQFYIPMKGLHTNKNEWNKNNKTLETKNLQSFVVMKMSDLVRLCWTSRSLNACPRSCSLLYKWAESNKRYPLVKASSTTLFVSSVPRIKYVPTKVKSKWMQILY